MTAKVPLQTLLGAVIFFFVLAALVGDFASAATYLFIAVVCTAGVSLVILLPVAWVVGWLVWELGVGIRAAWVVGWLVWELGVGIRAAYELAARSGGSA